jgi:hypothetical protein
VGQAFRGCEKRRVAPRIKGVSKSHLLAWTSRGTKGRSYLVDSIRTRSATGNRRDEILDSIVGQV